MKIKSLLLAAALAVSASHAYAEARFNRFAFTGPEDGDAQEVFAPDTAKIVLHVETLEVKAGQKLTAKWVAEKTAAAPPDYVIDTAAFDGQDGMSEATFSLSKPNSGWPAGDYRVELLIDGKAGKTVRFKVQ